MTVYFADINPILGGGGGGGGWTMESTPINIHEYFQNVSQHEFELF